MRAVLFDLDDTLIAEEPAAAAAFAATAAHAAAEHELDDARLALDARDCARELWWAGPHHAHARRIALSSWEGLWCRFAGDHAGIGELRAWAPGYRTDAWASALARQGVQDPALAERLAERFGEERRARHELLPGATEVLAGLAADHDLALVTNGASCLQREKLEASGLAEHFSAVVVAGDLGTRKPHPAVFRRALELLGAAPHEAVMVGDRPESDVVGAHAAGMRALLVGDRDAPAGVARAAALAELPALVRGLG